ncbi:MAG: polymer-forming cytoskeletal protein [Gemmatimonadetes bacterium]|nr:polymer-forming cytoskeletal protein [Gemmatimonadota bacterium]
MAMFSKTDEKTARDRGAGALRMGNAENAISIIGPGMRIVGDLVTDGTVRNEGEIRGTIRATTAVVVGREGLEEGDIFTQDAVIGGRVTGTVVAESRLELQSTCVVEGSVRARAEHLQLEEGARFNGQIEMIDGRETGGATGPGNGKDGKAQ